MSLQAIIEIVNAQNESVENVLGGGGEYIRVSVTDYDDSIESIWRCFNSLAWSKRIFIP